MDDTPRRRPAAAQDPAPYYRRHVFCCINERPDGHPRGCCLEKGAVRLRNYMKARAKELGLADVRINASGCLDRCELGPTMVIYPEGVWYSYRTLEDADEILRVHLLCRVRRHILGGRAGTRGQSRGHAEQAGH